MSLMQIFSQLFGHHDRQHKTIDRAIEHLQRDDHELERRLKVLRDQVDVYQRTPSQEEPHRG